MGAIRTTFALLLSLLTTGALGQTGPDNSNLNWIRAHMLSSVRADETVEHRKKVARRLFQQSDLDGGGISKSDYDLASQLDGASERQPAIANWASKDLDGDGKVTRAELERALTQTALQAFVRYDRYNRFGANAYAAPTEEQLRLVLDKLVFAALANDLDGDGVVTLEEVLESHRRKAKTDSSRRVQRLVPLSLDTNGDGVVSLEEFDLAVTQALREMDADGNGVFDETEAVAAKTLASALQRAGRNR